jgi:hypothetical protein
VACEELTAEKAVPVGAAAKVAVLPKETNWLALEALTALTWKK